MAAFKKAGTKKVLKKPGPKQPGGTKSGRAKTGAARLSAKGRAKTAAKAKAVPGTPRRKSVKKPAAATRKKAARGAVRKRASGLGRVKISSDARLDVVFQKDYQAREIFDFLRVQTLRELEEHSPDQILERLAGPMFHTVQRIRKALALVNRHLARDEKFAEAFRTEVAAGTRRPDN